MSNLKFSGQLVCKMAALRLFLTACLAIALSPLHFNSFCNDVRGVFDGRFH